MRKLPLLLMFAYALLFFTATSQDRKDIGVQAGGSYYLGDFNRGGPLYQPSPGVGVVFRYNLDKLISVRASGLYSGLKGGYNAADGYQPLNPTSFSQRLIEVVVMGEYNFFLFSTRFQKLELVSPYIAAGLGIAFVGGVTMPNLPIGVGVKFCPASRITVGLEWRFHKTLSDRMDSYVNATKGNRSLLHNNDWFSFAGLSVTYRLYNYGNTCPVYE